VSGYQQAPRLPSVVRAPGRARRTRTPMLPFAVAGGALALEIATHLIDFDAYHLRIRLLDSSYEWSWSHLLATVAFAAGAIAGWIGAMRPIPHRRVWLTICGLFAFLFVDNLTRLHEHIAVWPLIYAPLLAGLFVAIAAVTWKTDGAVIVATGIGLLFVSLAIHVFGPQFVSMLGWGVNSWPYQVKIAVKEGTELAGWVLLVPALGRLAFGAAPGLLQAR
jgi:hypothetical protein